MSCPERRTKREVLNVLQNRVSLGQSCLSLNWNWNVDVVSGNGILIQCSFRRPDTNTGEIGIGHSRQWHLRCSATDTEIVKTAFLAIKQVLEHELMEAFLVDGVRIFDPHESIEGLKRNYHEWVD